MASAYDSSVCSGRYPLAPRWPITSGFFSELRPFSSWPLPAVAAGAVTASRAHAASSARIQSARVFIWGPPPLVPGAVRTYPTGLQVTRGPGGPAHQQLGGQHHPPARPPARHASLEQLERGGAQQLTIQRDGGEGRVERPREVHVVEADDGHIVRDPQSAVARGHVEAGGDQVVVAEHGGRPPVEQRARRP